ncbi:LysR substrate-binding domain-containing protein [Vulcaniibacterium tengchongense]|uniref:LysR family glycine cleavage system transcriptional activator n=1 Tax=Vulcaniibacterium tengchongense TaxID=1273429 RepID=A0A3N4VRL6_9GAMM|nr:LysR substrate-binding domain-containing protein [Vulcaniibacterium tengchongense]RPE79707.1 LysR family glycine cleavage system transcriptional activator [Vulcaniibacterium tengchongense]
MPSPSLPPLSGLRAFEAAARLGSFARAAAELNMTPAAVSYQIKQLEARLGVVLFRRLARRVELTTSGDALAPAILGAFATMRSAIAQTVERTQDELSITTLPTVGAAWLAPKLGRFRARMPALRVRLDMSVPTADLGALDFDVAVRSGRGDWPGLQSHLLVPNLFTPVCSPDLLAEAGRCLRGDGPMLPLLGRPNWWRLWFGALGRRDVDVDGAIGALFGLEHLDAAAAMAGHGIAIVSPVFFQRELLAGRLVMPVGLVAADGRGYWLAYPRTQATSKKVRAFRQWIVDEAAADLHAARELLAHIVEVAPAPAA